MAILSYEERRRHRAWCREYIDREVIYRVDQDHPEIPSKWPGGTYHWQFYSRRATFNPHFARRLGLLFWDHFLPIYQQQPFQVCACAPSGPPIGSAIVAVATLIKVPVNLFVVRREAKKFGIDNWFDGRVLPKLPVLMVDDAAASANHLAIGAARVQQKLRLPLHRNYFVIVNKVGRHVPKGAQHTENYLDNELVALFTLNNFCLTAENFTGIYGHKPKWTGLVR